MNDAKAEDKPGAAGVRPAQAAVPLELQTASGPLLPENGDFEVELADVLDTPVLQEMMDDFYGLTGIGMAIVNRKGAILVATGWQDMCTKFHRVHPETRRHCIESDTVLSSGVDPGSFKIYRCKNNLWEMTTPIMLGDRHAGSLFLGQFIIEGEEPERDFFRKQAKRYGFDEAAYLAALDRLPRWSRERVNQAMAFYTAFARQISELSYGNIRLNRVLDRQNEMLDRLAQNEKLLRLTMQLLSDTEVLSAVGGWEWDATSHIMTWTEGVYRIHDFDPASVPPSSPERISRSLSCYDSEDRERVADTFRRCVENGENYDLECGFTTATGRRRRVRTIGRAIWKDGRVAKVFGNLQDITDQKQAEAAIRESEARYRELVENANSIILRMDRDGRVVFFNEYAQRFFGYTPDEILGKNVVGTIVPETDSTGSDLRAMIADIGRNPENYAGNVNENICRDGSRVWVLWTNRPVKNEAGDVLEILCIGNDITEKKRAEDAVRESEEKYRLIFNHAPLGLLYFDADGVIRDCNDLFVGIIGSSREALIGLNMLNLKDQYIVTAVTNALDGNIGFYEGAYHSVTATKNTPVRAIFTSMASKNGFPQGGVGIIEDVTRYKQAEDEKEKLRNQLMQAQKMESIGRLAGGVAHDFNNMLSVILGHTELAMDEIDPVHPLYADLKEIDHAACRSADLVRQLLAFARKQTIAPRILDLNETVEGMLKMLRRLIGENIELVWLPGKQLWPVRMDPSQIDQILANLCVNSRDAINEAGRVAIETDNVIIGGEDLDRHSFFVPGDYVLLTVTDDGCGMDPETLSHLFEPFFTTKEVGKGTGLGLATIYGIIKQNKGFITADSAPERGTTFKIYIPRHQAAVEAGEAEALPKAPVSGGNKIVLLVEDEPSILKMGKTFLERLGYRVLTAATPPEAINLAREHAGDIHLLMTDVVMPEMNGRDLAVHVASLYPQIKCLYMSGYTADIIAGHGVLDDSVHFIQKPFSRAELAIKVREALLE